MLDEEDAPCQRISITPVVLSAEQQTPLLPPAMQELNSRFSAPQQQPGGPSGSGTSDSKDGREHAADVRGTEDTYPQPFGSGRRLM